MYQTLLAALRETDPAGGIPSIVLLSDGEDTVGPRFSEFKKIRATAGRASAVPVRRAR